MIGNAQRNTVILNLWADGFSAGVIAERVGATRNVVAGTIYRARRRGDSRASGRSPSNVLPSRSEKQVARNAVIASLVAAGATLSSVAREFGLTPQRVGQIWHRHLSEVTR